MKILKTVLLVIFILSIQNIYSQCSDAGVCIIGEKHKKTKEDLTSSSLSFQYVLGFSGTPEDIVYHTFRFGGDYAVTDKFSIGMALPVYSMVYKDTTTLNRNGLGDAFIMGSYVFPTGKNQNLSLQGGFKLNTSSVDKEKFAYTNAQGTNDFLFGADFNISFFSLSGGFQVPLTSYENDGFKFKRGADFMIKGGFQRRADNFKLRFEILGIKRLSKSETTENNITSVIDKSDFFQLNLLGGASYNISHDFTIDLGVALPMIKREDNSDGTKRVFTTNLGFRYNI
jgi:hypothetical protein